MGTGSIRAWRPTLMAEPFGREGLELEEARSAVLSRIRPLQGVEAVPLLQALGRVTAAPLLAPEAVPGFPAAILDGYAVADAEEPPCSTRWQLVGRAAPGSPHPGVLDPGDAVRILTGAPLPEGAVRVLAQELIELQGEAQIVLRRPCGIKRWVRGPEEETAAAQQLVAAGQRLGPAELARLASCGIATVPVRVAPRIALLITGDELVPAGQPRPAGAIWESNGTLLEALLQRLGYRVSQRQVVADDPVALRQALEALAVSADVVVSTGGVSAGDSDWIRPLLAELGQVEFWKLFLKPGRPFAFGRLDGAVNGPLPFFGLPGNPVAAAVTALQLLWPALQQLEGAEPQRLPRIQLPLARDLSRVAGRPELARGRLLVDASGGLSALVEGSQASSRIASLQNADLLLELPHDADQLPAGCLVWAQLLRFPLL